MPNNNNPPPPKKRKRERLDKSSRIAIIGSGLAGLSTAISLELAGFTNLILLERDASVSSRREGYGLTLTYNPKGPLQHLGVLEDVANLDCPSRSHYLFQPDGSILGYYGNAFSAKGAAGQRGNLRLPRQVLRRLLIDKVKSPIVFGRKLMRVEEEDHPAINAENSKKVPRLQLEFEDGSVEPNVDFLVGADGIRSSVIKSFFPNGGGLNYLKVYHNIGISNFHHSLLDERGFYTLDGNHRLFTMPFEGCRIDDSTNNSTRSRRIMWQLSYRLEDYEEAKRLSSIGAKSLQQEVLRRCQSWHDPVLQMVLSTPLETIWGTGLMDRDPADLTDKLVNQVKTSRVVLVGDAIHPMSPFKGQGANQALLDGPLLASWLEKSSFNAARKGFLREMMQRTRKRVLASREAAEFLHSKRILDPQQHDFAGVPRDQNALLLEELRRQRIGAQHGVSLDEKIQHTIEQFGIQTKIEEIESKGNLDEQKDALCMAAKGDTQGLRNLSMKSSNALKLARNANGQSCLHAAVAGGYYNTCRWLLTEALLVDNADRNGKTACDIAREGGIQPLIDLFAKASKRAKE
eukprot:CAMPEP_0178904082 /NCGR_PEP_ID=MMETSP0786-20121207/5505_1 /TAXON_ID=186022 /ORGANISM="Thalassionema frauenfeldii, Strain CCMP 1798" /LENGTH=573 /DNA_ID=CAMNT_0020575505 /DNA_START=58 /DNA_END=1780 /DNA_ORIENTATION=+